MKKKVLIADRYYVAIKGLSFILHKISKPIIIDHALNKVELLDKISNHDYDLLILDVDIVDTCFEPTLQRLKSLSSNLKMMIFTDANKTLIWDYVFKGVAAVLPRSRTESEIHEAVKSIFERGYYYPQELLYDFIKTSKEKKSLLCSGLELLSNRERSVYFYLIHGNRLLEIANALGIHQSTVSIYKKRLFKKLNVSSLVELIHFYNKHGFPVSR